MREGIDLGMTLIDTAEMYGDGAAADIKLTEEDLAALDTAFPQPSEKQPLQML